MSRIETTILEVILEPCIENDFCLLSRLHRDPLTITLLGSVESLEKIAKQHRNFMDGFPPVDDPPSIGICRNPGCCLNETCGFEYPPGHILLWNDWSYELFPNSLEGE